MDKFEQQFENMDVQASAMEEAMSSTTTLTIPEVGIYCLVTITNRSNHSVSSGDL